MDPPSGDKAHCAACPASFATGPELAAHARSAHGMRVRNCGRTGTVLYEEIDVELLQVSVVMNHNYLNKIDSYAA